MIEGILQVITILAYLLIICGTIRVYKILLYLVKHKKRTSINKLVFNLFLGRKLYLAVLHFGFILFLTALGIQIFELVLELDKNFQVHKAWHLYIKDITFTSSLLVLLRLIVIKLELILESLD